MQCHAKAAGYVWIIELSNWMGGEVESTCAVQQKYVQQHSQFGKILWGSSLHLILGCLTNNISSVVLTTYCFNLK